MIDQSGLRLAGERNETVARIRAHQNTGGAILEFLMRTALHGKSRVLSAVSVCHNEQNFKLFFHPWW